MQIAPGVHQITTPLGSRISCLYLFVGSSAALLFDTGVDGTTTGYVLPYLERAGIDPVLVRHIVVSHCDVDHFGGLADARERLPSATTMAHEHDAAAIADFAIYEADRARGFRDPYGWDEDPAALAWARSVTRPAAIDTPVTGGETIDLGGRRIELLHVPGHTRGHLAIWDPGNRLAAISDAVLGIAVPHGDGSPAFPPTYRYVQDYLNSMAALEALNLQQLLTAHYPNDEGNDVPNFLAESRGFAQQLDAAVLAEVRAGSAAGRAGVTLGELLTELNPRVGTWPADGTAGALAFPVAGHLERHLARGGVRRAGERNGAAIFEVAR